MTKPGSCAFAAAVLMLTWLLSIVTAAVSLERDGETVKRPIVAAGGVDARVRRLVELERSLDGRPLPSAEGIRTLVAREVSPISDLRGSADLKRHLASVLVARALHGAVEEGGGQ